MDEAQFRHHAVSRLDFSHASQIAHLHQLVLSGDVLPALGYRFLLFYYQRILSLESQVVLGVLSGGALFGFCQLSFLPVSILQTLLRRPVSFLELCWLGLTKPKLFARGLWASLIRERTQVGTAEISFIAVNSRWQGKGIGKLLIAEANRLAYNHGKDTVITKTANERAKSIYEKTFSARVITERVILGERYWYLRWCAHNSKGDDC